MAAMQALCQQADKELVVYLSMGFGNPYGDPYSPDVVLDFTSRLADLAIRHIVPSDTVGTATTEAIQTLFDHLADAFPHYSFGAHLHALPGEAPAKVRAAVQAGVRRIDGAIGGLGGCPMAADSLTGNLPTEEIVATLDKLGIAIRLRHGSRFEAINCRGEYWPNYWALKIMRCSTVLMVRLVAVSVSICQAPFQ